ncbi:MAG: 3-isopropylmalate dehydratase large subunit [Tissierellia bacterium]|nr:3-isopropylmalate dehydratase large subunit [Tissierellia bacterium]
MKMTMTQKILANAAGVDFVKPGDFIEANLDLVLGNDITTPVAVREFHKMTDGDVFDKEKIAIVMDHFVPAKDINSANQNKISKDFAFEYEIKNFYDAGRGGVEHALLPEKGLVIPGDVVIGADSHTCTYGALGAFSTGVGSTDMAAGMATGKAWFRVPSALRFILTGKFQPYVSGKDLILHIIGMIGVDGARYKSMEFQGEGVKNLTIYDRLTVSNMAIEAGGKNGIFPVDEVTREFVKGRTDREWKEFTADEDAEYEETYEIDLSTIKPTVSFPHLPSNAKTFDQFGEIKIDQVVIGSCTNGNIKDMREAAEILKGHKVKDGVRAIVIPATQEIFKQCMQEGIADIFIDAGATFSTPTCGPCLGGYMGILAKGERAVSTTNRNFIGRMGDIDSEVYLASPAVAAASAITGIITDPSTLEEVK